MSLYLNRRYDYKYNRYKYVWDKGKENSKQMKRHINNPYKVNWMLYSLIGGISVLIMIVAVIWNNCTHDVISDVVKNLALGCVASTIVALLIEIGNVKEKKGGLQ